jgi:hypothetical protein
MTMGSASIFVWRVRLCLVLTAVGLVFVNERGKDGPGDQERMLSAVSVKCPPPASRHSPALPESGIRSISPGESDKHCAQLAGQAVIRAGSGQKFKPDVGSPPLGALRGG